jgi:3-deoxy-manno-octulosonate cytidylyltransferase (CMP-KDO synthetase)
MKVAAIIPARMQSTRLPGKPLLRIAGVPMIVRVLQRARSCPEFDRIIVATDSEEICSVVRKHGGEAWITSPCHETGSDRVAEVAEKLDVEFVLNLQGDEPLFPQSTIHTLVQFGLSCADLTVATPIVSFTREQDVINPNITKVVCSNCGRALYFSRYPIPYMRRNPLQANASDSERILSGHFKQVGMYFYRREFLLRFVRLKPTPLELAESLEQLRILENGYPIFTVRVAEDSISVDTQEDLNAVERLIFALENGLKH